MNILLLIGEYLAYIISFGLLYFVIRGIACKNITRTIGWNGLMCFCFIGTPLHELSHFLMCLLFKHRIEKVVLFAPREGRRTGEIGYVKHNYSTKNFYQNAGNFFIGIAPMIAGVLGLIALTNIFYPTYINSILPNDTEFNLLFAGTTFLNMFKNMTIIFNLNNLLTLQFWIYLFCVINISLNMSLSLLDLKHSLYGIVYTFVLSLLCIIILLQVFVTQDQMISILSVGLYYTVFGLMFGTFIITGIMLISFIFLPLGNKIKHKRKNKKIDTNKIIPIARYKREINKKDHT